MSDLHPVSYVILAALAVCVPPAATYFLMDHSDDPRPEGRAER